MSTPLPLRPRGYRLSRRAFNFWGLAIAANEALSLLLKALAAAVLALILVYGIRHGWLS